MATVVDENGAISLLHYMSVPFNISVRRGSKVTVAHVLSRIPAPDLPFGDVSCDNASGADDRTSSYGNPRTITLAPIQLPSPIVISLRNSFMLDVVQSWFPVHR